MKAQHTTIEEIIGSHKVTKNERALVKYMYELLAPNFGEMYSTFEYTEVINVSWMPKTSARRALKSLVSKKILTVVATEVNGKERDIVYFVNQDDFIPPAPAVPNAAPAPTPNEAPNPAPTTSVMLSAEEITEIIAALKMRASDKLWFLKKAQQKRHAATAEEKEKAQKSVDRYEWQLAKLQAQIDNLSDILTHF